MTGPVRERLRNAYLAGLGQVEEAFSAHPSDDEAIHDARKALKTARAVLRLLRTYLGAKVFKHENLAIRDAARLLSNMRDQKILAESLAATIDRIGGAVEYRPQLEELRTHHAAMLREFQHAHVAARLVNALSQAIDRAERWRVDATSHGLKRGIKRIYRRVRKAYDAAAYNPAVPRLHEFRKQIKYFQAALLTVADISKVTSRRLAKAARHIGELLGEDHDLTLLAKYLKSAPLRVRGTETKILRTIRRRQKALRDEAFDGARDFFEKGPRHLWKCLSRGR